MSRFSSKLRLPRRSLQILMSFYLIKAQWDQYYPKVYGYFFRRIDSKVDVEDLVSLTMEGLIKALNKTDKPLSNPNAYLWRIAHNHLADYIKFKSKTPKTFSLDENLDFIDQGLEDHRSSHFQAKVADLMQCVEQNLHGIEYKIVQLVVMFDQKSVDVANDLNLKPENVRQKLSRALKKLKANCLDLWNADHHSLKK